MSLTAKQEIIEGTWEEIATHSHEFLGHRLRVTILPDEPQMPQSKMLTKGMFPQLANITEEDFKIAEFHSDLINGFQHC